MNRKRAPWRHIPLGLFLGLPCWFALPGDAAGARAQQWQQVRSQLIAYWTASAPSGSEVRHAVKTLRSNGSWPDVDYTSQQRGAWATYRHIARVYQMALAYRCPGHELAGSDTLRRAITSSFDRWLERDYRNPNWWYGRIGVPKIVAPILILMGSDLPAETRHLAMDRILARSSMGMTGQNKVWVAGIAFLKGLLNEDPSLMQQARDAIFSELRVTTAEGVQPDYSFHQHGPQQQWGNYGSSFGSDMIQWATVFQHTRFALQPAQHKTLREYLLEGPAWIVWRGRMDVSGCGRQVFPDCQSSKGQSVLRQLRAMRSLDPACQDRYDRALASQGSDANLLVGHKHYWRSDVSVHRRPSWYASVKMSSRRVIGAETCNSENLRGLHLADGVTYFLRSGREYDDLFPVWDWRRLPGTTCRQDSGSLVPSSRRCRGQSDFVGGVTDGVRGIASMEYRRDGLEARKSWFFLDQAVVCLGSAIRCSQPEPVLTSINQCRLSGPVTVGRASESHVPSADADRRTLHDADWIVHDGVGYQLVQPQTVELQQGPRKGDWRQIHDQNRGGKARANVFSLWIDHGARPNEAGYAYVVYPDASPAQMQRWQAEPPARILDRTEARHAISIQDEAIVLASFFASGRLVLDSGRFVEVDRPCLIIADLDADPPGLWVAEPTHRETRLTVRLAGIGPATASRKPREFIARLPQAEQAGRTARVPTGP